MLIFSIALARSWPTLVGFWLVSGAYSTNYQKSPHVFSTFSSPFLRPSVCNQQVLDSLHVFGKITLYFQQDPDSLVKNTRGEVSTSPNRESPRQVQYDFRMIKRCKMRALSKLGKNFRPGRRHTKPCLRGQLRLRRTSPRKY